MLGRKIFQTIPDKAQFSQTGQSLLSRDLYHMTLNYFLLKNHMKKRPYEDCMHQEIGLEKMHTALLEKHTDQCLFAPSEKIQKQQSYNKMLID